MNDRDFTHQFLISRGWIPTGQVTRRRTSNGKTSITWWKRGDYECPQFFAADLEQLGWTKILESA